MDNAYRDKSFLFNFLNRNPTTAVLYIVKMVKISLLEYLCGSGLASLIMLIIFTVGRNMGFTFAASMALATVMNCSGETDLSSQWLRKVWSDPDLRFDISTPLSSVRTFHPSLLFPTRVVSEADNSSCIQLSLAKYTYLLRESSLMDLQKPKGRKQWKPDSENTIRNVIVQRAIKKLGWSLQMNLWKPNRKFKWKTQFWELNNDEWNSMRVKS